MPPSTPTVTPFGPEQGSKKAQVAQMFDSISPTYDALNHALSLGIDILWRRKAIRMLRAYKPKHLLDLATGTADFALEANKSLPGLDRITGMDISEGMLAMGREKIARAGLGSKITLVSGDAESLPLADESVDAITVGFGVRNFEDLEAGLAEMRRVLKPGGACAILEPAVPTRAPMRQLFKLYFHKILPWIGQRLSRHSVAYTYLPESVRAFPNGPAFVEICRRAGFAHVRWHPLTLGICSLYILEK